MACYGIWYIANVITISLIDYYDDNDEDCDDVIYDDDDDDADDEYNLYILIMIIFNTYIKANICIYYMSYYYGGLQDRSG